MGCWRLLSPKLEHSVCLFIYHCVIGGLFSGHFSDGGGLPAGGSFAFSVFGLPLPSKSLWHLFVHMLSFHSFPKLAATSPTACLLPLHSLPSFLRGQWHLYEAAWLAWDGLLLLQGISGAGPKSLHDSV